ncbi:O-antigen ligase family protein [Adhaeribacter swui]|uniref:O-antigen ligase family protein n=1 Tax=Adhaeribacter swui TaxID=2086471 RepID=A0A7G7G5G3_9BACT|nr:O-antigen ligase family protein [Adhaeribacter swui]QNF32397.1 O-antigen ligase family protein [Adhaeribacter swui]
MMRNSKATTWDWGLIITYFSIATVFLGSPLVKLDVGFFQLYPLRLFGFIGFFLILSRVGWGDPFLELYYKFSLFFLILGLVSIIWAPDTTLAIKEFGILQTGIALTWLVVRYINTEERVNTALNIWIIGALFVNGIGLYEIFAQKYIIAAEVGGKNERLAVRLGFLAPRAIFANQNNFAFFNALTSLLLLGRLIKQYRPLKWYVLNWLSFAISLYVLICCYSRAGIAAFGLGVALFFLFSFFSHNHYKQNLVKIIFGVVILFICLLIVNPSILDAVTNKLNLVIEKNETSSSSNDTRVDLYTTCLNFALDHLGFGMGPGSSIFPLDGLPPHNFFLHILMEYGIVILIGILYFLVASAKKLGLYQTVINNALPAMFKATVVVFPIMAIGPSTILVEGSFWLWYGLLLAYSSIMYRKSRMLYQQVVTQKELTI